MKKIHLAITAAAVLLLTASCKKPAESVSASSNPNIRPERLFTIDGCTMYRFYDKMRTVYFVTCPGGVSWREDTHSGKNTSSRDVRVETAIRNDPAFNLHSYGQP